MKKNVIKTAVAAVCVVAAGLGGFKAYNVANQSQANLLLAENIDAFSTETEPETSGGSSDSKNGSCWVETGKTVQTTRGLAKCIVCSPCPSGTFVCTIGETGYKF